MDSLRNRTVMSPGLDDLEIDHDESGLAQLFKDTDGLVMGRKTYDFVFDYGSWPYEKKPSWVCTSNELTGMKGADLRVATSIDEVIEQATESGLKHLWLLGGGRLASSFLNRGLITILSITEIPIKLGVGIPLFSEHSLADIPAEKHEVIQRSGFRQIEIVVANSAINCESPRTE